MFQYRTNREDKNENYENLEQITSSGDITDFDWKSKGIDISKKETNQVLAYLTGIKNYKNIRYFAEQSEALETVPLLEKKKAELEESLEKSANL